MLKHVNAETRQEVRKAMAAGVAGAVPAAPQGMSTPEEAALQGGQSQWGRFIQALGRRKNSHCVPTITWTAVGAVN